MAEVKNMPKKKNNRKAGFGSQQVFKYLRLAALLGPAVGDVLAYPRNYDKARYILKHYTGFDIYNQKFDIADLGVGYLPFLATTAATYGIPKLAGMIRRA